MTENKENEIKIISTDNVEFLLADDAGKKVSSNDVTCFVLFAMVNMK